MSSLRAKRSVGPPVINGDYMFNDINRYAQIYYSGDNSPVSCVCVFANVYEWMDKVKLIRVEP